LQIQVVLQQQFNTLLPLAKAGILTTDVHINATTGSTGAGVPLQKRHILAGDQTICHIKAFEHQHLGEINQSVHQLQADYTNELILYPTEVIL
jgi:N-acetyl-gamma-glutamyl-phosphate reductase